MDQAIIFFLDAISMLFRYLSLKNYQVATIENSLKLIFGNGNCRRKYTAQQVRKLFYLNFVKNVPAYKASIMSGINASTGTGYIRKARISILNKRRSSRSTYIPKQNQI